MNKSEWSLLRAKLLKDIHPSKPVFRKIGYRNGRRLYEQVGNMIGENFVYARRNPYIQIQLKAGNPAKQKRARHVARFFRKVRRSRPFVAWDGSFWRALFCLGRSQ